MLLRVLIRLGVQFQSVILLELKRRRLRKGLFLILIEGSLGQRNLLADRNAFEMLPGGRLVSRDGMFAQGKTQSVGIVIGVGFGRYHEFRVWMVGLSGDESLKLTLDLLLLLQERLHGYYFVLAGVLLSHIIFIVKTLAIFRLRQ
jgi:hypothetical protein